MLDPAALEDAADLVGGVYSGIEALMLAHLVRVMLSGDKLDQTSYTALAVAAQTNTARLQAIIDSNRGRVDEAVRVTVETYLREADEADMARVGGDAIWPRQVQGTINGLATVLDRDNIDMVEGAKRAFLEASGRAVTQVNTGAMTTEQALHQAVRDLEGKGIDFIQYRNAETGAKTVRNHSDVAVRRHVRTQIAQDAGRMTEQRMDEQGIDLVEVSSHSGARPSHAAWQGRCYSRSGEKEIDGTVYRDFYSVTGYDTGAGLCGWNCRHSFGPYLHGTPRSYDPNPKSETGLDDEEIYRLTQKQRGIEREIRSAKRELRGEQAIYEHKKTPDNLANAQRAKDRLRSKQEKMRDLIETSNARCKPGTSVLHRNTRREWAGDMPTQMKAVMLRRKGDTHRWSVNGKKAVSKSLLNKVKKRVEKAGGQILDADTEWVAQLDEMHASAVSISDTIILKKDATTSDLLEEYRHFEQDRKGMFIDPNESEEIRSIRREIDAKQYLIRVKSRYKIPVNNV